MSETERELLELTAQLSAQLMAQGFLLQYLLHAHQQSDPDWRRKIQRHLQSLSNLADSQGAQDCQLKQAALRAARALASVE